MVSPSCRRFTPVYEEQPKSVTASVVAGVAFFPVEKVGRGMECQTAVAR